MFCADIKEQENYRAIPRSGEEDSIDRPTLSTQHQLTICRQSIASKQIYVCLSDDFSFIITLTVKETSWYSFCSLITVNKVKAASALSLSCSAIHPIGQYQELIVGYVAHASVFVRGVMEHCRHKIDVHKLWHTTRQFAVPCTQKLGQTPEIALSKNWAKIGLKWCRVH